MARKNLKFELNPLLTGPSLEARTKSGSPYRLLALSEIDVDPEQPRRTFDPEALAELAASIKEYGVMSPILVRVTAGGTYRVIAGERRLRASKLLGLDTIPAIIDSDENDDNSTLAKQLVENLQRQDLSPFERAQAIGQLRDRYQLSVRDIARRLGASKSMVQRSLELLDLPDDLQSALLAGASESKVMILREIEDRELRKDLIAQLDQYSRDGLEQKVRQLLLGETQDEKVSHGGTAGRGKSGKRAVSADDKRIVDEMQRVLGTKVTLARTKNKTGQGKVIIEFYSEDDLGEVHRRLTN
ncbi:MAG: ParB/RepB/Spo0J family partition protein [Bdellovibrionota bacterium]